MYRAALLAAWQPGWSEGLSSQLPPGCHVVVFAPPVDVDRVAIEGRLAGLHLRDTLLVLRPSAANYGFLFRTPAENVVQTVIAHGTGALNIDATRVRWKSEAEKKAARPGSMPKANESVGTFQTRDRTDERPEDFQSAIGRWPANIALIHGPGCTLVGERRIEGHKGYPNGPGGSSSQFSQKGVKTTRTSAWAGHADVEGKETIPEWECQPNCPVACLDALSGELRSGFLDRSKITAENKKYGKRPRTLHGIHEPNSGGASRFYPQFANELEFLTWVRRLIIPANAKALERGV